jgi:hypothetical protein
MKTIMRLWFMVSVVLLVACSQSAITPMPAPSIPEKYADLPKNARMRCEGEDATVPKFPIWELPAIEPGDKNSAYQGNRGKEIARLKPCEAVIVVQVVWSEWSRDWYLLVKFSGVQGWIYSGAVELESTSVSTPTP